jgi:hypothetical protein
MRDAPANPARTGQYARELEVVRDSSSTLQESYHHPA